MFQKYDNGSSLDHAGYQIYFLQGPQNTIHIYGLLRYSVFTVPSWRVKVISPSHISLPISTLQSS